MRKGFTLVELLVVVTIMSLLASIAAVSYSRFVRQSRDARRKTDIEQVRAGIELYRNFKGAYPTPGMRFGIDPLTDGTTVYMSTLPKDPMSTSPTANTYYYTSSGTYQDYTLCAYIEGGETSVSLDSCGTGLVCNYCMGPYGQK